VAEGRVRVLSEVSSEAVLRDYARAMRRSPTISEERLWGWLRDRRFGEFKFRRQHPIGPYILDF